MHCIIPLAGPDASRALFPIDGEPLVKRGLQSREWVRSKELTYDKMIFVLRESEGLQDLKNTLETTFPGSQRVILSSLTRGALLSAAAGASLITNFEEPVVVDLIDIFYHSNFSPTALFKNDPSLLGIIPCFSSSNEKYSYLKCEGEKVLETREKKVISNHASAGTYFFRNLATFYEALESSIHSFEELHYKNALFLCPAFNLLTLKGKVIGPKVDVFQEPSLIFHT